MEKTKQLRKHSFLTYLAITIGFTAVGTLSGFFAGSFKTLGAITLPVYTPPMLLLYIMQPLMYFALGNAVYFLFTADYYPIESRRARRLALIALLVSFALMMAIPYIYHFGKMYMTCFILAALLSGIMTGATVLLFFIDRKAAVAALLVTLWLFFITALLVGITMYN